MWSYPVLSNLNILSAVSLTYLNIIIDFNLIKLITFQNATFHEAWNVATQLKQYFNWRKVCLFVSFVDIDLIVLHSLGLIYV